jgi:hypothetical protein
MTKKELILFISEANGNIRSMDDDSYVDYCVTLAPELAQEVLELRDERDRLLRLGSHYSTNFKEEG